jgi:hypothetical protein
VANAHCPNHRGTGINTAEWNSHAANVGNDYPEMVATMLSNHNVLAIASGAPKPRTATAAEFRGPCALDRRFGHDGATKLTISGPGLDVSTVLPMADGSTLVAGSTGQASPFKDHWLVGKLKADGHPDPTFGHRGWATLPWLGDIYSIATTSNGRIILGGDYRPKANGLTMVAEVTARGRLVRSFGVHSRARMPEYHDGGIGGVGVERNGDIVILLGGGNMGCWGVNAVSLTPHGHRVPGFTKRFNEGVQQFAKSPQCGTPVVVGGIATDAAGFHLLGTSQRRCVDNGCTEHPSGKPDPSRAIRDIAFDGAGNLDKTFGTNGETSFRAPMADDTWVLPQDDGGVLLATTPAGSFSRKTRAHLLFYDLDSAGHLDPDYSHDGIARIRLPYKTNNYNLPLDGSSALPVSNGRHTAIVVNKPPGNTVILRKAPK